MKVRGETLQLLQRIVRFDVLADIDRSADAKVNTDNLLEIIPSNAMVVFIFRGQDLAVNGGQWKGRVLQVELFICSFTHGRGSNQDSMV